MLLNPASGKFRGREIYEKTVTPLFEMADIQTDVISKYHIIATFALFSLDTIGLLKPLLFNYMLPYLALERGGHAKSILQEYNLAEVDGYDTLIF